MVGMSGGVDSSVAALMLQKQGFEVAGCTLQLWDSGPVNHGARDAKAVCDALGLPHYIFDFRERFRGQVVDYFAREYDRGATPNPCAVCNREIKFGALLQKAREMGFDRIATGHYVRSHYDGELRRFRLLKAASAQKDQSYVLYSLTQEQLAATLFPLGGYEKSRVRELAREIDIDLSRKADSQDICFIPDGNYAAFLDGYLGASGAPGDFIDLDGTILGRHRGIRHYTVGQRKGLGISFARPMFVAGIDARHNTVTLAPNEALMGGGFTASQVNWIDFEAPDKPMRLQVKIRYGAKPAGALVTPLADPGAQVLFDEPQRAITPGQPAVFYDGEYLVGGGIIGF